MATKTRKSATKATKKHDGKARQVIDANRRATVEKFVKMLDDKTLSWVKEWGGCCAGDPWNPCTGTHYSGANRVHLMLVALDRGDNRFCTMNQANKRGWKVRKGAHAHKVEKFSRIKVYERDDDGNVVRDADGAYYSPSQDFVNVPDRTVFATLQAALGTLAHEMGHSTGHADALAYVRAELCDNPTWWG